jgi:6-phosphogluconolactonase
MVIFDRTERWAIASDNGYDHLYIYPFSPNSRTLEGKSYPTPPGKAPRHFVFHPRAPYFFMTNEREASVSSFYFDSNTGELRPVQTIPTIPEGYSGPRVAPSNIQIHPGGRFLYAANRGDDSVAIFSIDEGTGRMAPVETVKTGGRGPREMNFEPSGKFFFICNLQSDFKPRFDQPGACQPNQNQIPAETFHRPRNGHCQHSILRRLIVDRPMRLDVDQLHAFSFCYRVERPDLIQD